MNDLAGAIVAIDDVSFSEGILYNRRLPTHGFAPLVARVSCSSYAVCAGIAPHAPFVIAAVYREARKKVRLKRTVIIRQGVKTRNFDH